jgi:endonuclease-3
MARGSTHLLDESSVRTILRKLSRKHPNPQCELYYETPFQLLVSVVLSAQATDVSVNKAMEPLYKKLGSKFSPELMREWGPTKILQKIRTIGLAPTKSKNIYKLSGQLLEDHHSEVPREREALEALAGVGRKTANVVLGEIFGEPTLAVDTHVFRVGKRLRCHDCNTPAKAEPEMLARIPKRWLPKAHHLFILHGRYTCKARKPECSSCCLFDICASPERQQEHQGE